MALSSSVDDTSIDTANSSTPPSIEPLHVDVVKAARLLRYSRATIYEMLNSGELPSTRRGASRRIPVVALRAVSLEM